ncbi:MAG: radical SAM protein [Elusimicrobiota bacterium]|jgi:pyruvate-formate lyase-activating enzyme
MSSSVRAVLAQCPGWGRECPPNALAALAAYARAEGFAISCHDLNNAFYQRSPGLRRMWEDKDLYSFWEDPARVGELLRGNSELTEAFVSELLQDGPRLVGLSVHTTSLRASLELARRIKRKDPSCVVVLGGPQCARSQAAEPLSREDCVDAVVTGEGEDVLVSMLRQLERSRKLEPLPGAIVRVDGRPADLGDAPGPADLDALPFPDYSDFSADMAAGRYNDPRRLELLDSRGCVRRCHFCSEWQFWKEFRSKSGERLFAEVCEQMRRHPGVEHFYFIGSLLNGRLETLHGFCDRVVESGLRITWEGQAVVRPGMDETLLPKMARAGCRRLSFGIESGSERVRRAMNKPFTNEEALRALRAARDSGMSVQVNFMFGLPTETREDFQQTLRFLEDCRPYIDSVLASQSFTVLDKGTALHRSPQDFGIEGQGHHLFWTSNGRENHYAERFRRYEEFCRRALALGLPETSGVLRHKPDKWQLLGEYYEHQERYPRAAACYRRALHAEGASVRGRMEECLRKAQGARRGRRTPLAAAGNQGPQRNDMSDRAGR